MADRWLKEEKKKVGVTPPSPDGMRHELCARKISSHILYVYIHLQTGIQNGGEDNTSTRAFSQVETRMECHSFLDLADCWSI